MKKDLKQLLKVAGLTWEGPALSIEGLNYDSRLVEKGDLFFAMKGIYADGHNFLNQVAAKGAQAALVEKEVTTPLPVLKVSSVINTMSPLAHHFFDEPSKKIPVVGVTGTNGKTTVTYLVEDILQATGKKCGVMGTINYRFENKIREAPNTTPLAIDVHKFLAELVQAKADVAVMEVSSHALALGRVEDVSFRVGVFMNLTQDHLDFHKDMNSYFEAKASLFRKRPDLKAVINVDDEFGARLADEVRAVVRFGMSNRADLRAEEIVCNLKGIHFKLRFPSGESVPISTNLMGRHNVSNCLASAGACLSLGLSESQVAQGLNRPHAIPGRLERVEAGQKFVVVVDYAHTHDALEKVLTALKDTGPKHLYCVFGAGGDRDRTKRPKMGRVAAELATKVFITSDNPRSENPDSIVREIEKGITDLGKKNYEIYVDRKEAIHHALEQAQEGDIVLIAGKGHETYQIIGNQKIHFSDQETSRDEIMSRHSRKGGANL